MLFVFIASCVMLFYHLSQMYEEAEAILKKLPKAVEENMDPPAESWSFSFVHFLHSHPFCHSTKDLRKE